MRSHHLHALAFTALLVGIPLSFTACLVSIDESLIDEGGGPADASDDNDSSVQPDTGDAADDIEQADADSGAEASTDAPDDTTHDAEPDADASVEADAEAPDADAGEPDGDAADPDGEAGDPFDGALVECYDDSWCPPVGCTLRKCEEGTCVNAGPMKEDVTTFNLPSALACNQGHNRTCLLATRNYLVALTADGFVVFNTRNPYAVKQEIIPANIGGGYVYLVRSGERLWAVKNSGPTTTDVAWLEVPLDNLSPFPPPSTKTLYLQPVNARFAAPNDALFFYRYDGLLMSGYFSRYTPSMLATPTEYAALGAVENDAVAASGGRVLLHQRVEHTLEPVTYRHRFSLQSNVVSDLSSNSGSYEEGSLTNSHDTYGYFASSRAGAVTWVIGRYDATNEWRDVRVFWLLADASAPIEPASVVLETFTTQPMGVPQGPITFINNETIATAVISGGASPSPSLDIVRREGTNPPQLVKRIPTSPLAAGALNVAGDDGYAYVATGTTVRMFAPSCSP